MLMRRVVGIIITIIFLYGCISQSVYGYKGAQYASSEAALQAQRDDINQMIAEIKPTNNPLSGKALVVLPSRRLIESKAIKLLTGSLSRHWIEHLLTAVELENDARAEALKRRKIFEEIAVTKSDQPETVTSPNYNFIIYLKLMSPDQMQWYLKTSSTNKSFPIYSDQSLPGMQQIFFWLDYIEKTAAEQLQRQKNEGK